MILAAPRPILMIDPIVRQAAGSGNRDATTAGAALVKKP